MVFTQIKHIWKYTILISILAVILILLNMNKAILTAVNIPLESKSHIVTLQSSRRVEHEIKLSCINVTDKMVVGSWKNDTLKQDEMAAVVNFHTKIRTYHGIPMNLQHKDKRCGNRNLQGISTRGTSSFRALCDPNGSTPCCFENKCVLKTVEECKCKNCYDLRQKLHAEVSTWTPADPTCKVTTFAGEEDSCKVLRNMTIYFIGDSFMRQLYIGVLSIIRKNKPHGLLINQTPADKIQLCDAHYALTAECSLWINDNTRECDNTTRLRAIRLWKANQMKETLKYIKELQGKPNSAIIISAGLHFQFNFNTIEKQVTVRPVDNSGVPTEEPPCVWILARDVKVLNPILLNLARSPWPKLIWLSANSAGLLKSPVYSHQQRQDAIKYNLRANDFMRKKGIPILDFFQMTEPVMSYDGTHYGRGVTDIKAQVFLNYILEMRTSA